VAEKKAYLGGFDSTEIPVFILQMSRARSKKRKFEVLGLGDKLQDLSLELITKHRQYRRDISKLNSEIKIGPQILDMMQSQFSYYTQTYMPNIDVDDSFCHGLLWLETDECNVWWHNLNSGDL
jgi:hypothetical protein